MVSSMFPTFRIYIRHSLLVNMAVDINIPQIHSNLLVSLRLPKFNLILKIHGYVNR